MARFGTIALISLFLACLQAQTVATRTDPPPLMTTSTNCHAGQACPALVIPGARVTVCTYPSCTASVTTYTDASAGTECPVSAPLTMPGSPTCTATTGAQGQFGFWTTETLFMYKVTLPNGTTYRPFPVSLSEGGGGGSGTVTSVGLSLPAIMTVSGSPVTTTGTLAATLAAQSQNLAWMSPNGSSGAPTFRSIIAADLPAISSYCPTCVTSASSLASGAFMFGSGSQGSQTVSATTATAALNLFSSSLQGLAPASGGGTSTYLRADGTWAAPSGSGTITNIATTGPITGGPITSTGTIACATCLTSSASLTSNAFLFGSGSQVVQAVTATTATAALNAFSSTLKGLAPASGGGTTNFLRADGSWVAPAGGGTVTSIATSGPITGGIITGSGTIACGLCVTSAASLTNNNFMFGAGGQGAQAVSATVATAALNAFSSSLKGLAPASGGGTANYLRADGTWASPVGGSSPFVPTSGFAGSISAAIASLSGSVGTVIVNQNVTITATVSVPSNVTVQCLPGITVTQSNAALDVIAPAAASSNNAVIGCNLSGGKDGIAGFNLSGFTAAGNTITGFHADGIVLGKPVNNTRITGNHILTGTAGCVDGIFSEDPGAILWITDNVIDTTGCTDHGIAVHTFTSGGTANQLTVTGNVITQHGSNFGIEIEQNSPGGTINGCMVSRNSITQAAAGNGGISVVGSVNCALANNEVNLGGFNPAIDGIEIANSTNPSLAGNHVYGGAANTNALSIDSSSSWTITGNVLGGYVIIVNSGTFAGVTTLSKGNFSNNVILLPASSTGTKTIWLQCNVAAGVCSNNILNNNTITGVSVGSSYGIYLEADGHTLDATQVINNKTFLVTTAVSQDGGTTNTFNTPQAVQGDGAKIQLSTGSTTTDDCAKFDSGGNVVDGGGGCVTAAATLTSTAIVTGAGSKALQTPSATTTLDSSGNISTPGSASVGVGGTVAGALDLGQGTLPTLGTTAISFMAPTSVTSYGLLYPGAAPSSQLLVFGAPSSNISTGTWTSPTVTVNGTSCTLGSSCSPSGASGITALTGDVTASGPGSAAATVAKVNGIAYSATAAAHTVQVTTTADTTVTAKVMPDCTDTIGKHLNFTQSTDTFSCGTSVVPAGIAYGVTTVTPPVIANWTTFGSAGTGGTRTDLATSGPTGGPAIKVTGSISTQNIYGVSTPVAAGDFTHIFVFWSAVPQANFGLVMAGFSDGTQVEGMGPIYLASGGQTGAVLSGNKATSLTGATYSGANGLTGSGVLSAGGLTFVKLSRSGTNLSGYISIDQGITWDLQFNDTTPFLTASNLVLVCDPRGAASPSAFTLISYN